MGGHGVGIGSSGKQPTCVGAQVDVSREGPPNRLDLDDLELSALRIGPVDRDAVVPPVGRIDEASVRVDQDLGRGVEGLALLVLLAQGGLGGEGLGRPLGRIPSEGSHREGELVEEVNEFSVRRETHVTGSATGNRLPDSMGIDGGLGGIDLVDHDLVEAEVGHEGVFAVGGKAGPVGMGRFLPSFHHFGSALVLGNAWLAQFAGRIKRKEGDRAPSVLGGEKKLSTRMNRDVTASAVGTCHAGEFLELSSVDLVAYGTRSTLPAAHRIENLAVGMQGEESGRADLGGQPGR